MLRPSALAALALGLGLTAASPAPSLFRRNDFDICPQTGNNVAVPDHNNFQFPLKGFLQNMCWPFCIGGQATCSTQTTICFDFVQYTLTFTYRAVSGYTYTEADIWLGFSAPTGPVTPQYTTGNGACQISADASAVYCVIPYEDIVGGTTNLQWLAGMCPNGDSQGLFFFLETNAQLIGPNGPVAGEGAQSCTDYPTCSSFVPYWELTYRCSFCQTGESSSSSSSSTTTSSSSSASTSSSTSTSSPTSTSSSISTSSSTSTSSTSSTTTSLSSSASTSSSTSTSSTSSTTTKSSSSTSTSSTSSTPSQTPCAPNVCFSTKFNSQTPPSGDVIWLSAVFKPKFPGSSATVSFTNSEVTINGAQFSVPDSVIQLNSNLQTCGTTQFVSGEWQATAPLPGSGNTFLSAVSVPVPSGVNWANAQVTWCGSVAAPGEVDVQIAAAVYTSCSESMANPEACETHTNYHAGVPTGCLNNLVPGGTGGGGSNFSGSLSATYPVCKAS